MVFPSSLPGGGADKTAAADRWPEEGAPACA